MVWIKILEIGEDITFETPGGECCFVMQLLKATVFRPQKPPALSPALTTIIPISNLFKWVISDPLFGSLAHTIIHNFMCLFMCQFAYCSRFEIGRRYCLQFHNTEKNLESKQWLHQRILNPWQTVMFKLARLTKPIRQLMEPKTLLSPYKP